MRSYIYKYRGWHHQWKQFDSSHNVLPGTVSLQCQSQFPMVSGRRGVSLPVWARTARPPGGRWSLASLSAQAPGPCVCEGVVWVESLCGQWNHFGNVSSFYHIRGHSRQCPMCTCACAAHIKWTRTAWIKMVVTSLVTVSPTVSLSVLGCQGDCVLRQCWYGNHPHPVTTCMLRAAHSPPRPLWSGAPAGSPTQVKGQSWTASVT